MKFRIIIAIILLIAINWLTPEFLIPYAQELANHHVPVNDSLFFTYLLLAIILIFISVKNFKKYYEPSIILQIAVAISLIYWAYQLTEINCLNCSRA